MTGPLTTREIMSAVHDVVPHVESLTEGYKQAAIAHLAAKRAFDLKEADAFLQAKKDGATDESAKRIALIKASDFKATMEELAAEKAAARLGSDAWQHVLDVYSALSHTLNRELKMAMGAGGPS
jgi:hypothetical protein